MKFSIIIPFLNSEKTLRKCLQSIVDQKYNNIEVILIDNGSTDNSLKVINEFDNLEKKYFFDNTGGVGKMRNIGLKNVTGDFILFLDSDDFFNVGLINCLCNRLQADLKGVDIVRFNANRIEYLKTSYKELNKYMLGEMSPRTPKQALEFFKRNECEFGPLWLYCYKSDFIRKNEFKFLDCYIHEDLLNDYILCKANKIANINFVGYNYVKNANGITAPKDLSSEMLRAKSIIKNYDYVSRLIIKDIKSDLEFLKLRMEIFNEMLNYNSKYFKGDVLEFYINQVAKRESKFKRTLCRLENKYVRRIKS